MEDNRLAMAQLPECRAELRADLVAALGEMVLTSRHLTLTLTLAQDLVRLVL